MRREIAVSSLFALVALAAAGCSRADEGEKIPLGAPAAPGALGANARAALEQGNTAYRERRYPEALAAYRRAAAEAPGHAAPLWGIQMAARAMGDSALADSAATRMRAISPGTPAAPGQDPHAGATSRALPPEHPPLGGAPSPATPTTTTTTRSQR